MPKNPGPRLYQLAEPVVAMRIAQPYKDLIAWCPEIKLIRDPNGSGRVVGVQTLGMDGFAADGKVGDYIQLHRHKGRDVYLCVPGHVFERDYREV